MQTTPRTRHRRSSRLAIGIVVLVATLGATVGGIVIAVPSDHHSTANSAPGATGSRLLPHGGTTATLGSFAWLASTTPPPTWTRLSLSIGLGSLSIPSGFRAVGGDPGTATFARFGSAGTYFGYLNVTPLQGDERLQGWAASRLAHLRSDDTTSATEDAAVEAVRTGGALRSCVTDDYVTEIGNRRYHEVACLVVAGTTGNVVVAATPSDDPGHLWTQLERAVAAYTAT